MGRQKKEKVDRNFTYWDIVERLGEDEDVSFERVGDTIIMRRREPQPAPEIQPEPPKFELEEGKLEEAERKLLLVKREIEKRKVVRKGYEELDAAFSKLEERLDSLEKELRNLRVELGYLRETVHDKLKEVKVVERIEEPKVREVVATNEKQLQLVEDVPEIKFERRESGRLEMLRSTLSNIYASLFLPPPAETRDVYREFQKKLFLLVRTQPRTLEEIAERTGQDGANCLIWLTRMVDEGLLEEVKGPENSGKRVYRIVWEKVR